MIKTLTFNVVAYAFSSILSALLILVMRSLGVHKNAVADAETYAVIPGLLSYSMNYYMYFWRSSEYRDAFKTQLFCRLAYKQGRLVKVTRHQSCINPSQINSSAFGNAKF
ncbi:hypothetical protein L596_021584 [Steinernema carpocapsae]|uniref:Uncharacterized protein n=1 Tax=Steinernema carpocapsae TaxID=34508 RepID=A0A4U5MJ63_STECR|nr:hypothetical protein L596_021584 [Steinernema carpocapsae]